MITISSVWLVIIFTLSSSGIITSASDWSYKHQDEWPALCQKGTHQSPIPLESDSAETHGFAPFVFQHYDENYNGTINNNGHTVEIRLNVASKPSVSGGGLGSTYLLEALHFHWESEHTINAQRFPLELHMVHYDQNRGSLTRALSYQGGVAVLAVLFYVSPDDDSELRPLYNAIENLLVQRRAKINDAYYVPQELELDDFLPRDRAGFYRYNGSLTTPTCAEGIIWTVFTNALPISNRQLKIFSKLRTHENFPISENYRPLQDVNDRTVGIKRSEMGTAGSTVFKTSTTTVMFIIFIHSIKFNW